MALFACKVGGSEGSALTASEFATASGSTTARTIPNVKKGDIIFMDILQAYSSSVTLTNATQIGAQDTWQAGTGSTWGFNLVAQATADGTVTVNRSGYGSMSQVKYSIATID